MGLGTFLGTRIFAYHMINKYKSPVASDFFRLVIRLNSFLLFYEFKQRDLIYHIRKLSKKLAVVSEVIQQLIFKVIKCFARSVEGKKIGFSI